MKRAILTAIIFAATFTAVGQEKARCKATTKAGAPCKMAPQLNGFCNIHNPAAPRCGAEKKTGGKCRMAVDSAGIKCRYHLGGKAI